MTFEYWLDHVSPAMHYDQQLQEALMINDVYSKLSRQKAAAVGEEFERPPPRTFRAVVHCEIVAARYAVFQTGICCVTHEYGI